ncbi:MAG: pyrroline-5-carboxylate reductase [Hyphomicrobiaceae bacterium]|nr:pyrroline-5-carboxylate reductase [Hyphomicrobiaceae bacterium]
MGWTAMTIEIGGPLVLVGCGKMGGAMLAGWLARGLDPRLIRVQEPAPPPEIAALLSKHGIAAEAAVTSLPAPPAVFVVAVKPQAMDAVFPPVAKLAGPETLVLSIAAGKPIASFERHLAPGVAVVRAMPNTPAAVGRGITVCCPNARVTAAQRTICEELLAAVGEVGWIDDERLMDAVTAVSGSGPAYVFLMAEALEKAAVAEGLAQPLARRLARATVAGSGELMRLSELDAAELRRNVTSPGGTTAAALSVLMADGGLEDLLGRAVAAAAARGRELGKS